MLSDSLKLILGLLRATWAYKGAFEISVSLWEEEFESSDSVSLPDILETSLILI